MNEFVKNESEALKTLLLQLLQLVIYIGLVHLDRPDRVASNEHLLQVLQMLRQVGPAVTDIESQVHVLVYFLENAFEHQVVLQTDRKWNILSNTILRCDEGLEEVLEDLVIVR